MNRRDEPIIRSLFDVDFYKFTMGQHIFLKRPDVPVTFGLVNRTADEHLAKIIDIGRLREELNAVMKITPTKSEIHYLRGTNEYSERMFCEPYLDFWSKLQLPEYLLEQTNDGQFRLEFSGDWQSVTYWETLGLSIINQLRNESLKMSLSRFGKECYEAEGLLKLRQKISEIARLMIVEHLPIKISDFGTRRRDSLEWQDRVVGILVEELPEAFLGTSNVYLAMKYGLLPMGTKAHEEDMVLANLEENSKGGLIRALRRGNREWFEMYGYGLSIALSDTFGTDFFLREIADEDFARHWKGSRQDSGDPLVYVDKMLAYYHEYGVDPMERMIIFSDGLNVKAIEKIARYCAGKIGFSFGWGTDLTNDLYLKPISLVCKVIKANGRPAVKLSDNIAKAIGPPKEVEKYKRWTEYASGYYKTCVY